MSGTKDIAVPLELRVLAGPQAGASCALPLRSAWELAAGAGAGAGADVLLHGSAAPVRLRTRMRDRAAEIELLEGQARLGAHALAPGAVLPWRAGATLALGDGAIEVAWGRADQALWESPEAPAEQAHTPAPEAARAAPRAHPERWLALAGAALALGSAGLWSLTQLLTPARAAAAPALRVAAAPDRAAAVAEVYRLHGLSVQAQAGGDGQVEVRVADGDAARGPAAQAAQQAALRDVPGLAGIAVKAGPAKPPQRPALPEDPGKRVTAVVADAELPYLVTADGSRYFVGALLPSGHRVVQIAERQVSLERDGQRTELAL